MGRGKLKAGGKGEVEWEVEKGGQGGKEISTGRGENEVDGREESVVKGKGERVSGRKKGKGR